MSRYTRVVLTVIAACLAWICVRDLRLWPRDASAAEAPAPKVVQADVVVARSYVLLGKEDKKAGEWSCLKGEPSLRLHSATQESAVDLAVIQGRPNLLLSSGRSSAKMGWYKGRTNLPEFVIRDAGGRVMWFAP